MQRRLRTIVFGAVFAALPFGLVMTPPPVHADSTTCTEPNIEKQFREMLAAYNALDDTNAGSAKMNGLVDRIWVNGVDCIDTSAADTAALSDETHGKWLDVLLIGHYVTALVKYAGHRYGPSRYHVDYYLVTVPALRPLAKAKGWKKWLAYEAQMTTVILKLDGLLAKSGYPPKLTPPPQ
jgi:hypothetical protein